MGIFFKPFILVASRRAYVPWVSAKTARNLGVDTCIDEDAGESVTMPSNEMDIQVKTYSAASFRMNEGASNLISSVLYIVVDHL